MSSTSPIDPPAKSPRLRRFAARALFVIACIVTVATAFYIVAKIRGRAAWSAYEAGAKQRGVKLNLADYIPPKIPDAENFASIPIFDDVFRATDNHVDAPNPFKLPDPKGGALPKFNDPIKKRRIDLAEWQKFFVEAKWLPAAGDNAATDVLTALDRCAAPLAQLHDAGLRPHCRFPVHWENAFAAALPHLQIFQGAAKILALRLAAHLALGDSAAAGEDFHDGLRLATAMDREPTLIAGLVRIAVAGTMENAVWGGLAGQQWAEPELRKIEADLAALDWLEDYVFALGSERGGQNLMIDMLIGNPQRLDELTRMIGELEPAFPIRKWSLSLYPTGWLYDTKVRANLYLDESLARVDPGARRLFVERAVMSSPQNLQGMVNRIHYLLFVLGAPVLGQVEKSYARTASVTDLARIACALERHRLARGAFPQALSELAPGFLSAVPAEIVNGEPYRYRRADDGAFLLYSVGLDLHDDGGVIDAKKRDSQQADWVWRYPAQ